MTHISLRLPMIPVLTPQLGLQVAQRHRFTRAAMAALPSATTLVWGSQILAVGWSTSQCGFDVGVHERQGSDRVTMTTPPHAVRTEGAHHFASHRVHAACDSSRRHFRSADAVETGARPCPVQRPIGNNLHTGHVKKIIGKQCGAAFKHTLVVGC